MSFGRYLIAAAIGAVAATVLFVLVPAGAATVTTLGAAAILSGGMVASAHIVANSRRNPRQRRHNRQWQQDQETNQVGSRPPGHRHIDPL